MYKCKSPVLLIFFNRPDYFQMVFEKVREVKPENLILVQDGPRNERDMENLQKCREIASNIDWDCNVIRDYSDVNLGCGMRPQTGITMALNRYDRVIILEDDCVPTNSFFRFCDEMLEKYKDDDRIAYVSGLNHFETWECGAQDYFFTKTGAIWGWATWANKWNRYYDYHVSGVNNPYIMKLVEGQFPHPDIAKSRKAGWLRAYESSQNGEKLSYWDNQWGFVKYSQNMLVIVPKVNQIYNVGVGASSTHAQKQANAVYKRFRNFFFIPTHTMRFPLAHPDYVICDIEYDSYVYKAALRNPIRRKAAALIKGLRKRERK